MRQTTIVRDYLAMLRRILRGRGQLLSFVVSVALHAIGHALMALVAGAVAVSLAHRWGMGVAHWAGRTDRGAVSDEAFLLSAIGLAVVVVKGAAGVYATFVQGRVAGEVGSALRLDLLDALLAQHHLRRPRHGDHGKLAAREGASEPAGACPTARAVGALTERVHDVELGLKQGLLGGARAVAQLVPLAVLLLVLSPRTAAVAVVTLGIFGWGMGRVRAGYRRATVRAARERERLLEAADESVRHAELWVTYGAAGRARESVRSVGETLALGSARLEARAATLSGANEVLGALALTLVIAASRAGWLGSMDDGATLLTFAVAFFLAYRPLRELADARLALERAGAAYDELREAIDGAGGAARIDGECTEEQPRPSWPLAALELRGLCLVRGRSGPLSARIPPGSIVAIAGPTGVGKTTLLRTLLGLERPAAGDIVFDGAPLVDAPVGPAGRPFAWVPQEAPLLADTLAANVALGAPDADVHDALAPIGAQHLALALGASRLGTGGRAVSGGERQWIALARAIATRQPVLLLDEPTSGLDANAQRQVLAAIQGLRGRRTVLIVTHRPEPLAVADVVLRLDPAGPVEQAA